MKGMHSARTAEIVLGDVLVESVEAEFVQGRYQLKITTIHSVHNGTFHCADRAIADNALTEIQVCPKSYPSAVAASLVTLLHDT